MPTVARNGGSSTVDQYSYTPRWDMHIQLKMNGAMEKRRLFDFIVGRMDSDYPQADGSVAAHRSYTPRECAVCGGWQWRMATLSAAELRRLASQINEWKGLKGHLKLKIKHLEPSRKCAEIQGAASAAVRCL